VATERGLRFKRAVKATVLGHKAFVAKLDKGDNKPKPKAVERVQSTLSSIGLLSPTVNLVKAVKTANDEGTLGFYSPKSKHLYVLGHRATPGVRAVLSHELTHALTDQWFGLRRPKLEKSHDELSAGFTALTEGDAERTRKAYEQQVLTPDERIEARKEESGGGGSLAGVPKIVLELIGFPYAIGPDFVDEVVSRGGIAGLNAAYKRPPTSTEQLVDPSAYFSHDDPKRVAVPAANGVKVDHGDLGYVGLVLMLENGLSRSQSQLAVTGWGGDQYATWRVGDHSWCLRDSVVMDYGFAAAQLDAALKDWAQTRGSKATIEHTGATTTFVTCSG
jgi:hypothetical protein